MVFGYGLSYLNKWLMSSNLINIIIFYDKILPYFLSLSIRIKIKMDIIY